VRFCRHAIESFGKREEEGGAERQGKPEGGVSPRAEQLAQGAASLAGRTAWTRPDGCGQHAGTLAVPASGWY